MKYKLTILFLVTLLITPSFAKNIPKFKLKDEKGDIVSYELLKGKPSIIVFWGLNCGSCKKELPLLNKFYEKYKEKINFYAVVVDTNNLDEIKERKNLWKFSIPVLIGNKNTIYKFKIFGVPITYLVDENLKIKKVLIGRVSQETIKKEIEKLLKN